MKRLNGGHVGCLIFIVILFIIYILFIYYERYKIVGLYHLLVGIKDIEVPIVKEEFPFDNEGYERVFKIKPKYRGYYDIIIRFENFDMSSKQLSNGCLGEIEISYIAKGKIKNKKLITNFVGYQFSRNYDEWYDSVYLDTFIYYNDIFRTDINLIKIEVNRPIRCFYKGNNGKTYIAIEYNYNL